MTIPLFQVSILLVTSILHLSYVLSVKPFIYDSLNYLEASNEFMVLIFACSFMCMTSTEGLDDGLYMPPMAQKWLRTNLKFLLFIFAGVNVFMVILCLVQNSLRDTNYWALRKFPRYLKCRRFLQTKTITLRSIKIAFESNITWGKRKVDHQVWHTTLAALAMIKSRQTIGFNQESVTIGINQESVITIELYNSDEAS